MKKVIKKNQVIITSLAILIAVAGYLNFADVDLGVKDKEASTDSSSILEDAGYDLTDSEDTSTPGEAVLTGTDSFAAQARISREQTRSQNKADLQDIINNKDIDDEKKQEAIQTMVSMTDITEKEAAAELLLEAKGFEDVIVTSSNSCINVIVKSAELSSSEVAQIVSIVQEQSNIGLENIKIIPVE